MIFSKPIFLLLCYLESVSQVAFEILIIFLLLAANGVFAMAEIAVVSSRKGKLRQLANAGNKSARTALELAESPNRFLSTVQIGITLVGIIAGAYGGATLSDKLADVIQGWPVVGAYSKSVSFFIVVTIITYFSLVLGELLPKRIGLGNPEGIAMTLAGFMNLLSRWTSPVVNFLTFSTDTLFRLVGIKAKEENAVSEEEVKGLMQEAYVPVRSTMWKARWSLAYWSWTS
jgi:putative hemolysin